ncbi:MAG TPA: NADH-quinone oxidoreductase subunit N [Nitrospirota bacterium]|nr:NADH-quinone oxidoreductase subunit N [Nitrospirota bacterium]
MNIADFTALSPYLALSASIVTTMLVLAFYRNHKITVILTLAGLTLSGICISGALFVLPREVTPLLTIDQYAFFFLGLLLLAGFAVTAMSYSYLEKQEGHREEFYLLLMLALLGCAVLTAATHFASFFLGIELLSVSLYALAAYFRHSDRSVEAGVKYLILAAVSSAFILFGMALVYAETGSLAFMEIASRVGGAQVRQLPFLSGATMIIVGLGFKLAVVPFHLWTPDVYEGAPAPVTAFIATASKGAVFALVLRYFTMVDIHTQGALVVIITIIAVASMFVGNLLALLQANIKRILAYSSISHLGYLLITILASGPVARVAAAFYLSAYFITTLGAFGVVTVLSGPGRDADQLDNYRGLVWRRPLLASVFTAMLFSLAGIPLTAGFIGKFYIVAAGVGSALWLVVIVLVVNSVIGLYYYLRIILVLFAPVEQKLQREAGLSRSSSITLASLTVLLVWLGVYPGPAIELIKVTMQSLL